MGQRSVVRTITVVEIIDDAQFKNVQREKVRTAELANMLADTVVNRAQAFRIEHNTIVIRDQDPGLLPVEIKDPHQPTGIEVTPEKEKLKW